MIMENSTINSPSQRDTYKIVERFASGKFKSELTFLKALVNELVEHNEFEISGGRIWELNPTEKCYVLRYQTGDLDKIPNGYKLAIADYPVLNDLIHTRTSLHKETDDFLINKGITIYSVTAVGEIIKIGSNQYYKYVLGFNAEHILQSFFEILSVVSSVASVKLRDLNYIEEQKKIRRDIIKASEIQRNLLPQHFLSFHDFEIFGVCIPDSDVGGDYFDYLKNMNDEEERIGIVISDAASKGLPAAIQSLFVSGAIRMGQSFSPKVSALISRLNTLIYDTFPYERFVTLFYCELTLSSNRLVLYANAGHCAPIHYRSEVDDFRFLQPTGGLLGIIRNQTFNVENIRLKPNDILVLYTDGISEAMDKSGSLYGEKRICDLIKLHKDRSAREIAYLIIEDSQIFSAESEYSDDKTIVVIKRQATGEVDKSE